MSNAKKPGERKQGVRMFQVERTSDAKALRQELIRFEKKEDKSGQRGV